MSGWGEGRVKGMREARKDQGVPITYCPGYTGRGWSASITIRPSIQVILTTTHNNV